MNRIERRIRKTINPYSTAFARWWCHSARYLPLIRIFSGTSGASRPRVRRAWALDRPIPAATMAARRAAIDAVLASQHAREKKNLISEREWFYGPSLGAEVIILGATPAL